ncbi:uncharacterized protein LOC131620092 [Vicia villosa]|uniref:uncharacterized protein LOC131620092 n=1 Tax=Vicia villosa TaxID=3911 RepID=UPI00273CE4E6|nr:uncharacterized protein LOC131620092 [Vicia villosa]
MDHMEDWWLMVVYASPNDNCKKLLWEELKTLSRNLIGGWMVAGDFNDIDAVQDKKGGLPASILRCQKWKFESFDQVIRKKKSLMRRLEGVQVKLQCKDNYGGMRKLEKQLQKELSDILSKEEMMWFQHSRTMWLANVDRNTKYYHMKTLNSRRRNKIVTPKKQFSCPHSWCSWSQTPITFPKLTDENLQSLKEDISVMEVKQALFSMKPWKAPGPDGFPPGFYQKSWKTLGSYLIRFVREVWKNPSMMLEFNKTDICLIPKV